MNKITYFAVILVLIVFLGAKGQTGDNSTAQAKAEQLVEQMRGFSMQRRGTVRSDGTIDPEEQRRKSITERLRELGKNAVPALVRILGDSDVQMRRNGELVLADLGGSFSSDPNKKVDISEAVPALIIATGDNDTLVRAWAAEALAWAGPSAKEAVPVLINLLKDPEEGPRNNSCFALGRIGRDALQALPALQEALKDPSKDVRRFARQAIDKIQNGSVP